MYFTARSHFVICNRRSEDCLT